MAKQVAQRPGWLSAPGVQDIYSVSPCVSGDFLDYIHLWRHNGYWLFDNPEIIRELSSKHHVDLADLTFFYYEVHELEFDEERKDWLRFGPSGFPTDILPPTKRDFHGYDIVAFSMGNSPECSPLSCNRLAMEIKTNAHCLLETFEEAKQSLESGRFDHTEPGPFRIFAVYTVDPDHWLDPEGTSGI